MIPNMFSSLIHTFATSAIFAIVYMAIFIYSLKNTFLYAWIRLKKRIPPLLYSARYTLTSFLSLSLIFFTLSIKHIVITIFSITAYLQYIPYESLRLPPTLFEYLDQITLTLCNVYVWTGLVYYMRQLVLKNSLYIKNLYCLLEGFCSSALIVMLGLMTTAISNFRLISQRESPNNTIILNLTLLAVIIGLLSIFYLSRKLNKNLEKNFFREIDLLDTQSFGTQAFGGLKKNNFHTIRSVSRNITSLNLYIISGLLILIITFLPYILKLGVFLNIFYIFFSILAMYICSQIKAVCVPAMTQTRLEE